MEIVMSGKGALIRDSFREKRTGERRACEVSIVCSLFNREYSHTATVIDFGSDGVRLISDSSYTPGAPISIRIDNWQQHIPISKDEVSIRTYAIGEVKWCTEITSRAGNRYEMGVRYFSTDL